MRAYEWKQTGMWELCLDPDKNGLRRSTFFDSKDELQLRLAVAGYGLTDESFNSQYFRRYEIQTL